EAAARERGELVTGSRGERRAVADAAGICAYGSPAVRARCVERERRFGRRGAGDGALRRAASERGRNGEEREGGRGGGSGGDGHRSLGTERRANGFTARVPGAAAQSVRRDAALTAARRARAPSPRAPARAPRRRAVADRGSRTRRAEPSAARAPRGE